MAKPKIFIHWGQHKEGYAFGNASVSSNNKKWHLVVPEPWSYEGICGMGCYGTTEFIGGTNNYVCPECAKLAGLSSADDWEVFEDQYKWGEAQYGPYE
jgi:hypothetical protein